MFCEFCPNDDGPCIVCGSDGRKRKGRQFALCVLLGCVAAGLVLVFLALCLPAPK